VQNNTNLDIKSFVQAGIQTMEEGQSNAAAVVDALWRRTDQMGSVATSMITAVAGLWPSFVAEEESSTFQPMQVLYSLP
jgi:alpha-D-ribose 1-methylphosphonate 5-triphosphate synthase subunit PhnG